MSVGSILDEKGRNVTTASPGETLEEISRTLIKHTIGAVVIVKDDGAVCGIASERDIVRHVAQKGGDALGSPVKACMITEVVTCRESDSIDDVMATMTSSRFRHLPVLEDEKLVGIISIGDIVKRKIEQTERDAEDLKRYIAG